jgi:CHAD domain-containing protein
MGAAPEPFACIGVMRSLPPDLLDRPAVDAAIVVASHYLDDAVAAATRLSDRADAEALHDFRVAVRRLRVTLRAYPGLHEGIPRKHRRRLRKLGRATNTIRDAEAQLTWFRDRSPRFTLSQRAALVALRARLRARLRRAQAHGHGKLQRRFAKLEPRIRHALTSLQSNAGPHEPPFRTIAGAALVKYMMDLRKRLDDHGGGATSAADLHATRIAAKRLRYLLEPVERDIARGAWLIDQLKRLQDLLGGLTDAHELGAELRRAAELDQPVGIAAATNVLETDVTRFLTTLRADWSTAGVELEKEVGAAIRQLQPTRPGPTTDRRRPARRRSRLPA